VYHFGTRSKGHLQTAHPTLQRLFDEVIKHRDCSVLCGHRNKKDQNKAFKEGNSEVKWPDGKHNTLPSRAVDVVPYPLDWEDIAGFEAFGHFVLGVAAALEISVRWPIIVYGGKDYPHFELVEE